jgi:hypothetical protein
VLENTVLRKIFVLKRDEVTVDWRKLNNEERHSLYSSPDIISVIKKNKMGEICSAHGGDDNGVQNFCWKA